MDDTSTFFLVDNGALINLAWVVALVPHDAHYWHLHMSGIDRPFLLEEEEAEAIKRRLGCNG